MLVSEHVRGLEQNAYFALADNLLPTGRGG